MVRRSLADGRLAAILVATVVLLRGAARDAWLFAAASLGLVRVPQTLTWGLTMLMMPLLAAWRGRLRYAVLAVWAAGWLCLLYNGGSLWWKVHAGVVPRIVLALTVVSAPAQPEGLGVPGRAGDLSA